MFIQNKGIAKFFCLKEEKQYATCLYQIHKTYTKLKKKHIIVFSFVDIICGLWKFCQVNEYLTFFGFEKDRI